MQQEQGFSQIICLNGSWLTPGCSERSIRIQAGDFAFHLLTGLGRV